MTQENINSFKVLRTETPHRKKANGDYIICVNSQVKKKLRLAQYAVVAREVKLKSEDLGIRSLRAHGKIVVDNELSDKIVLLDQTLRNAIGIQYNYNKESEKVTLHPLKISVTQHLKRMLVRVFGRRYLLLRVGKANPGDIEKKLGKVSDDIFEIMGFDSGGRIVLEHPIESIRNGTFEMKSIILRAYLGTESDKLAREKEVVSYRYLDPEYELQIKNDFTQIWLDRHDRERLGVDLVYPLESVRARRELFDLLTKEFTGFGLLFILSILAVLTAFQDKKWWFYILGVSGSFLLAISLIVGKIRSRVG